MKRNNYFGKTLTLSAAALMYILTGGNLNAQSGKNLKINQKTKADTIRIEDYNPIMTIEAGKAYHLNNVVDPIYKRVKFNINSVDFLINEYNHNRIKADTSKNGWGDIENDYFLGEDDPALGKYRINRGDEKFMTAVGRALNRVHPGEKVGDLTPEETLEWYKLAEAAGGYTDASGQVTLRFLIEKDYKQEMKKINGKKYIFPAKHVMTGYRLLGFAKIPDKKTEQKDTTGLENTVQENENVSNVKPRHIQRVYEPRDKGVTINKANEENVNETKNDTTSNAVVPRSLSGDLVAVYVKIGTGYDRAISGINNILGIPNINVGAGLDLDYGVIGFGLNGEYDLGFKKTSEFIPNTTIGKGTGSKLDRKSFNTVARVGGGVNFDITDAVRACLHAHYNFANKDMYKGTETVNTLDDAGNPRMGINPLPKEVTKSNYVTLDPAIILRLNNVGISLEASMPLDGLKPQAPTAYRAGLLWYFGK